MFSSLFRGAQPTYHSRFGGLWVDRSDWRQALRKRKLTPRDVLTVRQFVEQGYVILEGAASASDVDAFQRHIAQAFREGDNQVLYQRPSVEGTQVLSKDVNALAPGW